MASPFSLFFPRHRKKKKKKKKKSPPPPIGAGPYKPLLPGTNLSSTHSIQAPNSVSLEAPHLKGASSSLLAESAYLQVCKSPYGGPTFSQACTERETRGRRQGEELVIEERRAQRRSCSAEED